MPRRQTPFAFAFALAAPLALSACLSAPRSTVRHLTPPPVEVAPAPVPVRLGLHLAPDFTGAWWAAGLDPVVPIGEDSEALVRRVLTQLVGPVPEVAAAPPFAGAPPPVDLVLVPSVADFSTFGTFESAKPAHAVTWRLALFEPDGDLVSSWLVRGEVPPRAPRKAAATEEPAEEPVEPDAPGGVTHAGVSLSEAGRRLAARHRADAHLDDYLARRAQGGPAPLTGLEISAVLEDQPLDYYGAAPTFTGSGLVPVRIRLTNRTDQVIRLDGLFTQLRLADGRVIHPAGQGIVMGRILLAGTMARLKVLGGPLGGGLAAFVVSTRQAASLSAVEAQVAALGLEPAAVAPGATLEGLVTFLPQRGGPASGPATVEIWVTDDQRRPLRASAPILVPPPPKVTEVKAEPET